MDWQQIASLAIVALTALLMVRGAVRKLPGGGSSCSACTPRGARPPCQAADEAAGEHPVVWETGKSYHVPHARRPVGG